MTDIFDAIQRTAKRIKKAIDVKDIGYSQQSNSSGETQLQLDIQGAPGQPAYLHDVAGRFRLCGRKRPY